MPVTVSHGSIFKKLVLVLSEQRTETQTGGLVYSDANEEKN